MPFSIMVKYCGGCNPRYDRTAFVQRLVRESGCRISPEDYDIALVVCGCDCGCAAAGLDQGRYGKVVVTAQRDYECLNETIASIMNRE